MITIKSGHFFISIMILYAFTLHITWAVLVYIDPDATHATAISILHRYIDNTWLLSWVMLSCALMALMGLFSHSVALVIFLLPQQILLMMSASGAVEAIWLSQFADGVVRPRAFIAADQCYSILAAIGHTVALIAHANRISHDP